MVEREGKAERFGRDPPGDDGRVAHPPGADLEVGVPAVERDRPQLVPHLRQMEPDLRVQGAEAADEIRHEPGAKRVLERQRHPAGVGIDELAHGSDPVVELMQQRVDVLLEHRARMGHPQNAAAAPQQWRADLGFEPGQRSRYSGLGHPLQLADLGHGRAVGDLLEPAQRVSVHFHDASAWFPCFPVIGRINGEQED